jgi:UDP-N-acetylmuramate--alanine ligase
MENKYKNIYFLGIGGIGMSALAQYFHFNGYNIAGYDRTKGDTCERLEKLGIEIHYSDSTELIPQRYKSPENTLVVFTPAIPNDSDELSFFIANGFTLSKRAEVLGMISRDKIGVAIAGTHGKTSVSTISAWIFKNSDKSCSAFMGGISKNFDSNIFIDSNSDFVVAEADEFDRSFLHLSPSTAIITGIEADHLDIYNDFETLQNAFVEFAGKIKPGGNLIINKSIDKRIFKNLSEKIKVYTYGLEDKTCDFYVTNIQYRNNCCYFDIIGNDVEIKNIEYQIGGNHNLENALAASVAAILNNIDIDTIKSSLESFKGVVRRFDVIIKSKDLIYIDDYAHHPGEIKAFLNAVKEIITDKKITAIFQPHLFSRTRDFYKEFAQSLSVCDELILLPIYPAREKPIEGINSEIILELAESDSKYLCEKEKLIPLLKSIKPQLLVTMGAGDIDQFVEQIRKEFE